MATSARETITPSGTTGNLTGCSNSNSNHDDLPGIFSVVFNRNQSSYNLNSINNNHHNCRWSSFSMSTRSFWTKYCLLCTVCGSAATILAGIFLVVAALFRYYTTSIYYFETVPTYIPAILLSICGVSTIAFSCKRNRNIILLRITACWSLVSAALSSVITITTSLIHMNRLQTLKECVYNRNPPGCTCFGHSYGMDNVGNGNPGESTHYVFENTPDCDVIHGILYSCLRAVFAISVVAVLLSIFLCMLLYQLIGHERKKAYWSRIRRINSDWSADFLACLARPMPRERSSLMPLMMTPSGSLPLGAGNGNSTMLQLPTGLSWGPPPPYEPMSTISDNTTTMTTTTTTAIPTNLSTQTIQSHHHHHHHHHQQHNPTIRKPSVSFIAIPPVRPISISTSSNSSSSSSSDSDFLNLNPHPFSPTITTVISTNSSSTTTTPCTTAPIKSIIKNININISNNNSRSSSSSNSGLIQQIPTSKVPPPPAPPILLLRESKISIDSGSDNNLYSQDEESFQEKMIPFDIQKKLLLLDDDEKYISFSSSCPPLGPGPPGCSCLNEILISSSDISLIRNSHSHSKGKKINSLPSSPLLNSFKNFLLLKDKNTMSSSSNTSTGTTTTNIPGNNYLLPFNWEQQQQQQQRIPPSTSYLNSPLSSYRREVKTQSLPGSPLKISRGTSSSSSSTMRMNNNKKYKHEIKADLF